ncbi:TetR/AcrR family transcriptional regulator [Mycobacterium paragordonae]|jgi:AcrR family transcriptional regulator|uniref:TetR family transcriptional regulator n=1 Tax=Mycobacterium paragordonae TaxID=1389713 RepID=A0ABQ1CAK6_9MYCO|nr:TetR/AcrR family transcriptional regulator [Mycobacterium paragordonae]AYE97633.1 TetR/AcrR family transcriptional regulator [Mycobacterium paragordonae]OBJ75294.1 TetR family transcriptional regulator [Mycobacterium gordonae]OBK43974.1 TetR family transcriptional regulator [Mycobacterium gordonae]GFG81335.1 TetR family transcriptional regulator [Mycobacterium paragordonae]
MTSVSTAKATRVTKRRAETRGRLIDAAIDVFAEKGYGQVTIKDVCTAAGYTRGAFYSQFESLEELLFVIYHQWTAQIAEQVRSAVEAGDPVHDLPGIIARIAETLLLEREWLLIKVDLLAVAARNPELAQRWSVHRGKLRMTIEDLLTGRGIGSHESIGSAGETAQAIIALYDGLATQLLLENDDGAARSRLIQLLNVLLMPDGTGH